MLTQVRRTAYIINQSCAHFFASDYSVIGDLASGDLGLAAMPGREEAFRASLANSINYAKALECNRWDYITKINLNKKLYILCYGIPYTEYKSWMHFLSRNKLINKWENQENSIYILLN